MATYMWEFGAEGTGLHFTVAYDDVTKQFAITAHEGSLDVNALWSSNLDGSSGAPKLDRQDNALNMNGANTVWDDEGNPTTEKIDWDGYLKLSNPGLGPEAEDKATFVAEGETVHFDLCDFDWAGDFDPTGALGVRATSVNGGDSIKWVDREPVIDDGEDPVYFTINLGDGDMQILADADDYDDNTQDPALHGAAGDPGQDGDDVALSGPTNVNGQTVNESTQLANGQQHHGEDGQHGEDGMDAIEVLNAAPYDGIKIVSTGDSPNYLIGGSGGEGGQGGDGASITITAGNNANDNDLTAGDGGDGGNGGLGGHAIVNGDLHVVIIEGDQNLTILGGGHGQGGSGGDGGDVTVTAAGNNANNNTATAGDGGDGGDGAPGGSGGEGGDVSIASNLNTNNNFEADGDKGNDGVSPSIMPAFSHSVEVDSTAFTGDLLTISGSPDGDTMAFGAHGTVVYATTGSDTYVFGAGDDVIIYTSASQSDGVTSTDTIDGFDPDADRIDISALVESGWTFEWDNVNDLLSIDFDNNGTADVVINLLGVDTDDAGIELVLVA